MTKNFFTRPDVVKDTLYVITPIFNAHRYRSRWKLYKEFEKYVTSYGEAHLVTIECTFGQREKAIVEPVNDRHTVIHVQTKHELWLKENLINIAIQHLPEDWKYVAWVDSDVSFARTDWVGETIQKLQHYDFVQMFSEGADMSPKFALIKRHWGFMYCYKNNIVNLNKNVLGDVAYGPDGEAPSVSGAYWHPGFAWATKRDAINSLGGLIDWGVLGGGDMFMAYALIGKLSGKMMPVSLGKSGVRLLKEWQERAERYIRRNVGYMDGLLIHYWHGRKSDRRYQDRGQVLVDAKFDPELDLKKDWQGLYQLTDRSLALRDGARSYFAGRNEDSIDTE